MDNLPVVGDVIGLIWETEGDIEGVSSEDISGDYVILARDLDEGIWTCWCRELKRLELFTFDENGNYQRAVPDGWVIDPDDEESS